MKKRIEYIDALRGFAILGVIVCHVSTITRCPGLLGKVADLGAFGVQLFFVISAFTIFLTFGKSLGREQAPVRNFFIRRIFRIAPVYWLGIVLYASVYGNQTRGWTPGPDYWHYPLHVFLVNLVHPLTPSSVVPGGWSISCEMLFYLTVPLWFACIRSLKSAAVFVVLSSVLCPLAVHFLKALAAPHMTSYPQGLVDQFFYRNILNQLPCFACGILLYYLTVGREKAVEMRTCLALFAAAAIGVVAGILVPTSLGINHIVTSFGFVALAVALSSLPLSLLVNKATIFVGKISYSAYLVHFLVLEKMTAWTGWSFVVVLALALPITLGLAWLSYRFIELPCSNLGRRWIDRLESGATAPGALAPDSPLP